MEQEQLLSGDDDDLAFTEELPSINVDGVHCTTSGHDSGAIDQFSYGKRRLANTLRRLRQTWFMKEMLMLLNLSIPSVSLNGWQCSSPSILNS